MNRAWNGSSEEAATQGLDRDFAGAYRSLTQALAWSPLDWRAYYMRGAAGVYGRRDPEAAQADFRRARYLEGMNAALPMDEAQLWAVSGQMPRAVSALLEACRRDPARATDYLRPVYLAARQDPDFVEEFGAAARRDPVLTVALLRVLEAPDSAAFIAEVLDADPDLQRLSSSQKTGFFQMWALRGDPRWLVDGMAAHPAWQPPGWRWWADARARAGAPDAWQAAVRDRGPVRAEAGAATAGAGWAEAAGRVAAGGRRSGRRTGDGAAAIPGADGCRGCRRGIADGTAG